MIKNLKTLVISNTSTINEAIDYMESFCKRFNEETDTSCFLSELECFGYAVQITQMAELMDSCEQIIKQTCQAILTADLDVEAEDIGQCFEMYSECSNRYERFKEEAYKTILNEDYLKIAFKQNNNDEGEEKMITKSETNKINNSMEGENVMKKYTVNCDKTENHSFAISVAKEIVEELNTSGCEDLSKTVWDELEARLIYDDDRWDLMKMYQNSSEADYNEAFTMCCDEICSIIEETDITQEPSLINSVTY